MQRVQVWSEALQALLQGIIAAHQDLDQDQQGNISGNGKEKEKGRGLILKFASVVMTQSYNHDRLKGHVEDQMLLSLLSDGSGGHPARELCLSLSLSFAADPTLNPVAKLRKTGSPQTEPLILPLLPSGVTETETEARARARTTANALLKLTIGG